MEAAAEEETKGQSVSTEDEATRSGGLIANDYPELEEPEGLGSGDEDSAEEAEDEEAGEDRHRAQGKRASAKTIRAITIEQLIPLFSLTLEKAAQALNISATSLKKVRRRLNIPNWPYRSVRPIVLTSCAPSFAHFSGWFCLLLLAVPFRVWTVSRD